MNRTSFLLALVVTMVLPGHAGARDLTAAERVRIAPGTLAEWDRGAEELDVIVHLHAPPEAKLALSPRGIEQPRARLAVVSETLTRVIGELRDGLAPEDLLIDHVSPLRPELAARVSRAGLEALVSHPAVRFVEEDVVWWINTSQGIPLIKADVLHDLGYTGEAAGGTWALEVDDDDPATAPGPAPTLLGWALEVTTAAAVAPTSFIPVVIHAGGANETFWVTDVRVLNPSPTTSAALRLYFVPAGTDGTTDAVSAEATIAAASILDLPDVVQRTFGVEAFQGNVLLESAAGALLATSRTYNTGGDAGTYGQFVGMTGPADGAARGDEPLVLLQLASNADFRTNVGVSETAGQPATVTIALHDGGTGSVLATSDEIAVEAYSNTQVNRVFDELGAPTSDNAYAVVTVTSGSGRVVAYASVVDNLTGDAILIPGARPVSTESLVVPIVAKVAGVEDTNWVSDVRSFNGGDVAVTLDLELRPEIGTGAGVHTATVTVAPGQSLAMNDVMSSVFGLSSGSGSLRLAPQMGAAEVLVTSRTYNQTGAGTYGQFIAAVAAGDVAASTLIHLDMSDAYRSNVGFCEVSGGTLELAYTLRTDSGATLGSGSVTLGPFQVDQVNDIFAAVGAAPADNARLDIHVTSGDGAYTAYASVVDNASGDAIAIPSARLPN